jgi:hypothetical protein
VKPKIETAGIELQLAMLVILGMMFQNDFISTPGPSMWLPGGALATDV